MNVNNLINQQRRRSVKFTTFPLEQLNSISMSMTNSKTQNPSQTDLPILKKSDFSPTKLEKNNKKANNCQTSIPGLNSDLIDNMIFVSQKPTSSIIQQYDLVNIFKEFGIVLVVNIQLPYENEKDKSENKEAIDQSGYSYSPAIFSSQGISVLQSGWKKYTVPDSVEFILKIIREIAYITQIEKKKVLLHSHSGINRTAVIIVCYKIFLQKLSVDEAIETLKNQRKCSVISQSQREFCIKFKQEIMQMNLLFPSIKQDIATYLKNEFALCYIPMSVNLDNKTLYIPKIIRNSFNRLMTLTQTHNKTQKIDLYKALNGSFDLNELIDNAISTFITKLTITDFTILEQSDSIRVISEVLYRWFENCIIYCINPSKISQIFQMKIEEDTIDSLVINTSFNDLNMNKIQEILTIIFNTLNKGEYELIKYISSFLAHILPTTPEEMEEYDLMVQKLVIYLIGYNIDMLFIEESNNQQYKRVITQTVALFHFLISSEIFNEKVMCQNGQGYEESKAQASFINPKILSNLNEIEERIHNSINNQNEQKLYEIYQALKKHYAPREKNHTRVKTLKSKLKTTPKSHSVTFSNNNIIFKA